MFFVYVLQSIKTKAFYKGLSANVDQRIYEHLTGKCFTTKKMLPIRVIHVEICEDRAEARKLEKFFKSGYGREVIDELTKALDK